ncbi:MAG: bifunctional phosphoribosyl-AMP cyclohydrolase/phosphoribosyl-ATP diphosphatase HisIE [Myxococcota bacterium]
MDVRSLDGLKYKDGLVTVVAQDYATGTICMLAHATKEALAKTLATGKATFWSRSRSSLWTKGETSGNMLHVKSVWLDCDGDAVIYLVEPTGPSCHTGAQTCFFERLDGAPVHEGEVAEPVLARLERELQRRKAGEGERSYTRRLLERGTPKISEKIREEAGELCDALADETDERVVSEAADLVYHVMVGLLSRGVPRRDVEVALAERFGISGLDEKASRTSE